MTARSKRDGCRGKNHIGIPSISHPFAAGSPTVRVSGRGDEGHDLEDDEEGSPAGAKAWADRREVSDLWADISDGLLLFAALGRRRLTP